MPIIPALKRLRQEDSEFEASLGHIASSRQVWITYHPCLDNKQNKMKGPSL
jgi:hypothetical protein